MQYISCAFSYATKALLGLISCLLFGTIFFFFFLLIFTKLEYNFHHIIQLNERNQKRLRTQAEVEKNPHRPKLEIISESDRNQRENHRKTCKNFSRKL